ncbi:MAG: PQQ-like beta-propeller repeat protein [Planctomycetes bacterium]|nr:PQQ-like beta-propeller repeat protein [Planctomycetota bacterium]
MNWLVLTILVLCGGGLAAEKNTDSSDWPQWRGPNRDGIAQASPKLLDAWPKEGPPQLWKSEWIPGCDEGGMGSPVVADGKVFLYVNWKQPVAGGTKYKPITLEVLADAGWLPDLPDPLAKKIEDAWASPKRPSCAGWRWWSAERPADADLDAFLAKNPELDKYIKEFTTALSPDEAKKYGAFVRRRLCINKEKVTIDWVAMVGETWENLVKLSKLRDLEFATYGEYVKALGKNGFHYSFHQKAASTSAFNGMAWERSYKLLDTVVCLDAATGKVLWKKDFPEDPAVVKKIGNDRSFGIFGSCSTPAVLSGKVYAAGAAGLYALSAKDGAVLWQTPREPSHASPLVAEGIVYHAGAAYNAETGKPLWQNPLWKPGNWTMLQTYSSPLLWTSGGRKYVITTSPNNWCCLDLETGKPAWTIEKVSTHFAAPVLHGDVLLINTGEFGKGAQCYKISVSGTELLWKQTYGTGQGGGIVDRDHVYLFDALESAGIWRCVDAKSGEIAWAKRVSTFVSESNICWPFLADGKIYGTLGGAHTLWYHDGKGFAVEMLRATPNEPYAQLGQFNPGACPLSSPAFAGGKLYVRLLDSVACYDLQDHAAAPAVAGKGPVHLKFKTSFGNQLVLESDAPIGRRTAWNSPANFAVEGAIVARVEIAPGDKFVIVTTDKAWKPGDAGTLSYAGVLDGPGDAPREKLAFTAAADPALASVKFVKVDETTSGNWKGVYGAEGVVIPLEKEAPPASLAVVTASNKRDDVWRTWANAVIPPAEPRNQLKPGDSKDRSGAYWAADMFEIDVALPDGKEHRVAFYCLDATGNYERQMRVDVRDFGTKAVLDSQTLKAFRNGKYLVWNLKGHVTLHFLNTYLSEAAVSGVFIDPPEPSK